MQFSYIAFFYDFRPLCTKSMCRLYNVEPFGCSPNSFNLIKAALFNFTYGKITTKAVPNK